MCYISDRGDVSLQSSPVRKFTDIQARIPTLKRLAKRQTKKEKTVISGGMHTDRHYNGRHIQTRVQTCE